MSALGLVIAANVVWALVQPLLPVLVVIGLGVVGISAWQRWRWR